MSDMRIAIVAGISTNGVIGSNGALPWRLPADLRRFKAITMGKAIVMGRKTHESIGRVLPGRKNIIISRERDFQAQGCMVINDPDAIHDQCADLDQIMIIGGARLYAATLAWAGKLYITEVHAEIAGDVYFPDFDRTQWREVERRDFKADDKNEYDYSFVDMERL